MHFGLYIPLFDELADPALVARLCAEAEEAGWDGVFVWDQVRWREPVVDVADPQITLAAIASATERIRLGPMVTPLARRRPVKVARETATLDRLSDGRLTLGVGLGSDHFASEYSITGEELDDRRRARMLDEALDILQAAWSGELVRHRGEHYTVDAMRFLPRPMQRPGIPIWVAGFYGKSKPLRRAIRYQGFFPVGLEHPDQLAEIAGETHAAAPGDGAGRNRPFRLRRRTRARQRPGALRGGWCDLGSRRVRLGSGIGRPGTRRDPRRTGKNAVALVKPVGPTALARGARWRARTAARRHRWRHRQLRLALRRRAGSPILIDRSPEMLALAASTVLSWTKP
jgi:hypothetical protein